MVYWIHAVCDISTCSLQYYVTEVAYLYVTYDALTVDSIIYTMSSLYILPLYLAIAMISFFSRVLFQIFGLDIVGKT